ncbi:MAG: NADH-quinone oxidoreductase subunit M, partial [Deltaproteobacteria bacterium]|nr:NADH-quinone oxidoreductase subunit M [Deltaproteobacteria bacterium]
MLLPRDEEGLCRQTGLVVSVITFLVSLGIPVAFDPAIGGFQLETDWTWIASLGVQYHVGVDGISLWLVMLTTFLTPIVLLSAQAAITKKVKEFVVTFLILETGMLGAFLALDLFLFYVFWEIMLVPMYLIIGVWGGDRRIYASIKFVIYTMVGSLLMLVAILYLYVQHGKLAGAYTFDYVAISKLILAPLPQLLCFGAFGLAFAIKVPMFPLHTWLPDAHVEAPTAGSVILAGVLLKFGTYGFIRFAMPMFPYAANTMGPVIAILAVIGIIYGSLVAWAQGDVKKLIAYSSVAHLGLCMLGLFTLNARGVEGSIYQMLNHGISTGGLFLAIGVIYERRHTRKLDEFGGLWAAVPTFGAFFLIICLSSIALPGTNGFVGEFLVLFGTFDAHRTWVQLGIANVFPHPKLFALLAATGAILGAVYLLWMFQKVMFGPITNPKNSDMKDLSAREIAVFLPIIAMIFVMGLWPRPFTARMDASVNAFIQSYQQRWAAGPKRLDEAFANTLVGADRALAGAVPAAAAPRAAGPTAAPRAA